MLDSYFTQNASNVVFCSVHGNGWLSSIVLEKGKWNHSKCTLSFSAISLSLSLSSQKQIVWSIGNGFIYQEFICTLVCVCESACIWVEIEPHLLSKSTNKRKLIMRKENKTECTGTTIVPFNNWKGILIPFANVDWYHFTIVYAINDDWASF